MRMIDALVKFSSIERPSRPAHLDSEGCAGPDGYPVPEEKPVVEK